MPFYTYVCEKCGNFDKMRPISDRDTPVDCPECGEPTAKRAVTGTRFNLTGDGWPSKNIRVANQMSKRNRHLKTKEEEAKHDGRVPSVVPNVGGEITGNWEEAGRLAKSKGKDTSGYEKKVAEEKALKAKPSTK
jgi:putative FmdB family regulatory protein